MTIAITHKFVSAKGDGTDPTLVKPSNWNDAHTIQLAANKLVGRLSSGTGDAEEVTLTAFAALILAAADVSALQAIGISVPTTGDAKLTLKTAADSGWVLLDDGTIGNASSGASTRANADTSSLFTLLYGLADADCPIFSSGGVATTRAAQGSASSAFTAGCRMSLPKTLGRALVGAGAGSGLTSRTLGSKFGGETVTLQRSDLPNVSPTFTGTAGTVTVTGSFTAPYIANVFNTGTAPNPCTYDGNTTYTVTSTGTFTPQGTVQSLNGGVTQTGASIVQPSSAWNVMVKL